jgi:hypothetical protein
MSTSDTAAQTSDKFVELLTLLLDHQASAETRRQSHHQDQTSRFQRIEAQLDRLLARLDEIGTISPSPSPSRESTAMSISPAARKPDPGPARSQPAPAAPAHSAAWADWEQQKQQLLQELGQSHPDDGTLGAHAPAAGTGCLELGNAIPQETSPAEFEGAPADRRLDNHYLLEQIDQIEHLDPADPALHDDEIRRQLVAKLRKVEVDLSLERAHLARQRSDLEARIAEFEQQRKNSETRDEVSQSREGKLWRIVRPGPGKK